MRRGALVAGAVAVALIAAGCGGSGKHAPRTRIKPGQRYHVSVTLRLTGFGAEPASHAPPPQDVGDLLSTLQALGF